MLHPWLDFRALPALIVLGAIPVAAADHSPSETLLADRPTLSVGDHPFSLLPQPRLAGSASSSLTLGGGGIPADGAIAAGAMAAMRSVPGGIVPPSTIPSDPPELDTLERIIEENPEALGSLSIGLPDGGLLVGGVQLEDGPLWHVRNPRDTWGTTETLGYLAAAIQAVERAYPGSPSLCIGDISHQNGGPIDRHRSHQAGRDVDLGWYFSSGESRDFRAASRRSLDLPRCWALVRALVTETDVERIFMDASIQRVLFSYALERGEDRTWLEKVFSSPGGRRDTIVQHERGHRNHLHVRFYNPRSQEWGRVAYPLLAKAGLAPPPVVQYRARRGDTLSTIAHRYGSRVRAIRAANGLSSNLIRAGRRYRVPVRRLASAMTMDPVIVPPRLLPPDRSHVADGMESRVLELGLFVVLP